MKQLQVYVELRGESVRAGTAYFNRGARGLSTSFSYERSYLADHRAYPLDPQLPLLSGSHTASGLPGAFADCAPDRWGQGLIGKRIRATALASGTHPPTLDDVDFLTGVSDLTRQGALRFRETDDAPFVSPDSAVPRLIELPELLHASDVIDTGGDDLASVKALLGAGTGTLGGARPKASVRDDGALHVAKFPKPSDEWNVIAWEMTALDLADSAGVTVPRHRLVSVDGRNVLLLRRFDRTEAGRIGYWSVMTMMQMYDGDSADYVDIAETLPEFSSQTATDLRELWRRIAFSIAVHNTDDHLRNHGLLRDTAGWRLAPAFDINPNPDTAERRATSIGGASAPRAELDALMAYRQAFGVTDHDARQILGEILEATSDWRRVAGAHGISPKELQTFTDAFEQPIQYLRALLGARKRLG